MGPDEILSRLVQVGTVTSLDAAKHRVRVKFQDTGLSSGWLYVLQRYNESIHIEPDGEHGHSGADSEEPDHNHTRSYVTYWMPFIGGGWGLHDADWRSSFGGSIYKGNGSHGCVNLPPSVAKKMYAKMEVGTPVIVY